jgi:hypothetical protein
MKDKNILVKLAQRKLVKIDGHVFSKEKLISAQLTYFFPYLTTDCVDVWKHRNRAKAEGEHPRTVAKRAYLEGKAFGLSRLATLLTEEGYFPFGIDFQFFRDTLLEALSDFAFKKTPKDFFGSYLHDDMDKALIKYQRNSHVFMGIIGGNIYRHRELYAATETPPLERAWNAFQEVMESQPSPRLKLDTYLYQSHLILISKYTPGAWTRAEAKKFGRLSYYKYKEQQPPEQQPAGGLAHLQAAAEAGSDEGSSTEEESSSEEEFLDLEAPLLSSPAPQQRQPIGPNTKTAQLATQPKRRSSSDLDPRNMVAREVRLEVRKMEQGAAQAALPPTATPAPAPPHTSSDGASEDARRRSSSDEELGVSSISLPQHSPALPMDVDRPEPLETQQRKRQSSEEENLHTKKNQPQPKKSQKKKGITLQKQDQPQQLMMKERKRMNHLNLSLTLLNPKKRMTMIVLPK